MAKFASQINEVLLLNCITPLLCSLYDLRDTAFKEGKRHSTRACQGGKFLETFLIKTEDDSAKIYALMRVDHIGDLSLYLAFLLSSGVDGVELDGKRAARIIDLNRSHRMHYSPLEELDRSLSRYRLQEL